MKNVLIALGSLMMSVGAAQAYTCQVDLVNNRGQVIDTFYAQEEFNGTCRDGLRDCNRERQTRGGQGARCETRQNPGPGPGPINPGPINPGPGPGQYSIEITAIVENHLVVLQGHTQGQLFNQCVSQVPNTSADEITLVANNAPVRRLTTSGWWYNSTDICSVILQNADLSAPNYRSVIDAFGSFENRPFNIRAYGKAEALAQCHSAYAASGLGSSDELTIGVNNSGIRRITTSGWWYNSGAVCLKVMEVIDQIAR